MKKRGKVKFWQFYLLSLFIVILVMALSFFVLAPDSLVLMQKLGEFLVANKEYPNILSIGKFTIHNPLALLVFVFAAAPSISAVLTKWIVEGKEGVTGLFRRFKPILQDYHNKDARKVYVWIFTIYGLGALAYILIGMFAVGGISMEKVFDVIGHNVFIIIVTLALGIFLDEGGTLEELGWRGFGLPTLMEKFKSPIVATLLLAFFWWFWHSPRELASIVTEGLTSTFLINQAIFLLLCIALSILISFCVFKTGGSVLPAILIHGGTNVWSKALSGPMYELTGIDVRTYIVIAAAIVILIVTKGKLGYAEYKTQ